MRAVAGEVSNWHNDHNYQRDNNYPASESIDVSNNTTVQDKLYIHIELASDLTRSQPTNTILGWCWASVVDAGLTSNQHCVNVTCLLGVYLYI